MSKRNSQNRVRGNKSGDKPRLESSSRLSSSRLLAFRIAAALIVPLVLLGLLELGLRLAGYGYPTKFFLHDKIAGKRVWIENDQFGLRFFPPALARSPSPLVMDAAKPQDVRRIFVLGESAALGDPEPAFGFGRFLQVLLEDRFPSTRFEVVCTAMTAINSHTILPIARDCAKHQGDIWVIYMGNNEFVGPFGPSTVFGTRVPPLDVIRLSLAFKNTRLGQLLSSVMTTHSSQKTWGGMKMFLDHQVRPEDPRKQKTYNYFESNLDDILKVAHRAGVQVLLSSVAVNLKDCAPFGSQHAATLSNDQLKQWQAFYDSANQAQDKADHLTAISNYQAAAQIDRDFAELQFRWARSLLALTNLDEARTHFELARDEDCLPFRADGPLNEIIRRLAARHTQDGVTFVDVASLLARQSADGILGRECLFEHVHLNFEGNYWAARALAESIASLSDQKLGTPSDGPWPSFDRCARQLALTDWDRSRVYGSLLDRLAEPPFVNQLGHLGQLQALRQALVDLRQRETPAALAQARLVYQQASQAAPGDFYLHADFAKLEEDAGDFAAAAQHWRDVRDSIPFSPGPHYYLGRVLSREGKTGEALAELDAALKIRPDLPDALEQKGLVLVNLNRFDQGLASLERAADFEPNNYRICLERGEALASCGRRNEAIQQLARAALLQPGSWEAHYRLGVLLALGGSIRSAAEQFTQTVRINPDYPLGHLNLGIALAKLERTEEAMLQFQETLRLAPDNRKAFEYLHALQGGRAPSSGSTRSADSGASRHRTN